LNEEHVEKPVSLLRELNLLPCGVLASDNGSRFLRASFAGRRVSLQSTKPKSLRQAERNPFHVGHNELANYTPRKDDSVLY
jgi:hypothetical protein